jgi:hypothetical protein
MTYFPQPNSAKRAPRIKFKESVPVAIRFEGAQSIEGKLHDLSVTGGLLILSKPLEDGGFVEVQFLTRNGLVHGMAEILSTRTQSTSYCLQPFRFIALDDEDHNRLRAALKSASIRLPLGQVAAAALRSKPRKQHEFWRK